MKIIRVFSRRTKATPDDNLSFVKCPPPWYATADEVYISVVFTYDLPVAEKLEKQWRNVAPCKIGGPALGDRGAEFTPGLYVKNGYVITSRGCPNSCWFCDAWKREGHTVREYPIMDGFNLLDSNILRCSKNHFNAVCDMLKRQKSKPEFTGGLEAAALENYHIERLRELKPKQLFFAYDTPDDLEPLREAGDRLIKAGFTTASHALRAYVLCGYPKDTFLKAEKRMIQTAKAGFLPMAMLYMDKEGFKNKEWGEFQRKFARPAITSQILKKVA